MKVFQEKVLKAKVVSILISTCSEYPCSETNMQLRTPDLGLILATVLLFEHMIIQEYNVFKELEDGKVQIM